MADPLLDQLRRDMQVAGQRAGISHISQNSGDGGNDKSLLNKGFPTFPTFPTPDFDAAGSENFDAEIARDRAGGSAGAGARARGMRDVGKVGNVGNANAISGIDPPSFSHLERESGKCGKSWPPPDLIAPGICREDILSLYEERAAIREFDGGMTRRGAEAAAVEDVRQALREGRIARDPPPPPTGQ